MNEKIRTEFAVHVLNEEGMQKAKDVAHLFTVFLNDLEAVVGTMPEAGREMALVRTKLQEANFFAKRAVAVQTINQKKGE